MVSLNFLLFYFFYNISPPPAPFISISYSCILTLKKFDSKNIKNNTHYKCRHGRLIAIILLISFGLLTVSKYYNYCSLLLIYNHRHAFVSAHLHHHQFINNNSRTDSRLSVILVVVFGSKSSNVFMFLCMYFCACVCVSDEDFLG